MTPVFIEKLFAFHFRNLTSIQLNPDAKINVFHGTNGQGKTNLLEAICLGSSLKTINSLKNIDLIYFGQEQSRIKATINALDNFTVEVNVFNEGKKVQIGDKKISRLAALNQKTAVITFTPEDLCIVAGSATYRRRWLDQCANCLFPIYATLYNRYEKTLAQRNRLLKMSFIDLKQLISFNDILAQTAAPLLRLRQKTLTIIRPEFKKNISRISGNTINAKIEYASFSSLFPDEENEIKNLFYEQLAIKNNEELIRKTTLVGPHLDDINITINNIAARNSASRGQARAIVLALKIAQIDCTATLRNITPILLLDDVMGELDLDNAKRLLATIKEIGAQTFITMTHLAIMPAGFYDYAAFSVNNGQIIDQTMA